ncbi:MAG: DUF5610 domain-containing protein [Candidatus Poribacteria bacterium]|nr:DUF5610 domain-containing protein [Candidatus Poribacteria bacterium]
MNEIYPISPHNFYASFDRQRILNYEKLNIQTYERTDLLFSESDSSDSRRTNALWSRQQSLSYERLTVQDNVSRSQLQRHSGGDQLDLRASQQYGSYLFVEKITLRIEEQFGFSTEQTDRSSGLDTSIQGAASSVFELSITVYSQYEPQALEADESADRDNILAGFMEQIQQAIKRGFQDAMNILEQMNGFNEKIRSSLEESYYTLKALLDRFEAAQREGIDGTDENPDFQADFLATQQEILSVVANTPPPNLAEIPEPASNGS